MTLEERVERALANWRIMMILTAVLSFGMAVYDGEFLAGLFSVLFTYGLYFAGLFVMAQWFSFTTKPGEVVMALQARKIQDINERLENGTLEKGSEELERLMKEAGLKPLTVMESFGPVFGRLGDTEIFEWVDAKQGSDGETKRYTYVTRAQFDADGTVVVPDDNKLYIVIDGCLYEHNVAELQGSSPPDSGVVH